MSKNRPTYGKQSAWGEAFERENARRRREQEEAERLMSALDEEPGRPKADPHILVWVTPEIALCPVCQHSYRRVKLPNQKGTLTSHVQAMYDRDDYMRQCGLFVHARHVLEKRQAERQAAAEAKDTKKRGGKKSDYSGLVR